MLNQILDVNILKAAEHFQVQRSHEMQRMLYAIKIIEDEEQLVKTICSIDHHAFSMILKVVIEKCVENPAKIGAYGPKNGQQCRLITIIYLLAKNP